LLLWLPLVALTFFAFGFKDGVADLRKQGETTIVLSDNSEIQSAVLMRTLQDSLLVRNDMNNVIVVNRSNVAKIVKPRTTPDNASVACAWFGVLCSYKSAS
jgi:hypothetical protein